MNALSAHRREERELLAHRARARPRLPERVTLSGVLAREGALRVRPLRGSAAGDTVLGRDRRSGRRAVTAYVGYARARTRVTRADARARCAQHGGATCAAAYFAHNGGGVASYRAGANFAQYGGRALRAAPIANSAMETDVLPSLSGSATPVSQCARRSAPTRARDRQEGPPQAGPLPLSALSASKAMEGAGVPPSGPVSQTPTVPTVPVYCTSVPTVRTCTHTRPTARAGGVL